MRKEKVNKTKARKWIESYFKNRTEAKMYYICLAFGQWRSSLWKGNRAKIANCARSCKALIRKNENDCHSKPLWKREGEQSRDKSEDLPSVLTPSSLGAKREQDYEEKNLCCLIVTGAFCFACARFSSACLHNAFGDYIRAQLESRWSARNRLNSFTPFFIVRHSN